MWGLSQGQSAGNEPGTKERTRATRERVRPRVLLALSLRVPTHVVPTAWVYSRSTVIDLLCCRLPMLRASFDHVPTQGDTDSDSEMFALLQKALQRGNKSWEGQPTGLTPTLTLPWPDSRLG